MLTLVQINMLLKDMMDEELFSHSVSVQKVAVDLAVKYSIDEEKAGVSGLIHDCAKPLSRKQLLRYNELDNLAFDDITMEETALMHGPVGTCIAKERFQIEDKEILNAVYHHTTGKPDMTALEKIIYLADFIEPNRTYEDVKKIREIAFVDLDRALLMTLNNSIKHVVLNKNSLLHPRTVAARNFTLKALMQKQGNKTRYSAS